MHLQIFTPRQISRRDVAGGKTSGGNNCRQGVFAAFFARKPQNRNQFREKYRNKAIFLTNLYLN